MEPAATSLEQHAVVQGRNQLQRRPSRHHRMCRWGWTGFTTFVHFQKEHKLCRVWVEL